MGITDTKITSIKKTNDAMFKALFRSMEMRNVLASFLSEITGIEKELLIHAAYIGGELTKEYVNEKGQSADVVVKLEDDTKTIVIEMNQELSNFKIQDKLRGALKVFIASTKVGEKRYHQVSLININDFNYYHVEGGVQIFQMRDQYGNFYINNNIVIYDVVLDNLLKEDYNNIVLKKFAEFMKTDEISKLKEIFGGDEEYMEAAHKVEELAEDPDMIFYYNYEEKKQEELEFVRAESFENGVEHGIKQEKYATAKELIKSGIDLETISKCTNIPIEELEEMR